MSSPLVGQSRPGGVTARTGSRERARRQYLLGLVVAGLVILALLLVFAPSQALLSKEQRLSGTVVAEFVPQGWAFFTRDPREPYVSLYQQSDGDWEQANSTTMAGPETYFGLDRSARTENYEIDVIANEIPADAWVECEEELVVQCLPDSPEPVVDIRAYGEDPRFCGLVAVTHQEPVPWAWAGLLEEMPGKYVFVEVECREMERGQSVVDR